MNTLPFNFYVSPTPHQKVIQDAMKGTVLSKKLKKASRNQNYLNRLPCELIENILQNLSYAEMLPTAKFSNVFWHSIKRKISNASNKERLDLVFNVIQNENDASINNLNGMFRGLGSEVDEVHGGTALHIAVRADKGHLVPELLKLKGIDVNAHDNRRKTALGLAIGFRIEEAFDKLINAKNINLNIGNGEDNNTALHLAIRQGNRAMCRKIISSSQCDINIRNNDGEIAQHMAARFNEISVLSVLMQHKDFDVNCQDDRGNTALINAIKGSYTDIAFMLLKDKNINIRCQTIYNTDALYYATENKNVEVFSKLFLMRMQEMVTLTDDIIDTMRNKILAFSSDLSDIEKFELRYFFESMNGSDQKVSPINIDKLLGTQEKFMPNDLLIEAINYSKEHLVSNILDMKNLNVNIKDNNDISVLYAAAREDLHITVLKLLYHCRIDVNSVNGPNGLTPLQTAAFNGNVFIVKNIVEHPKCEINYQDKRGFTALHYAAKHGNEQILNTLLEHKEINISLEDKDGNTPLMIALAENKHQAAKILLASSKV